MRVVRLGHIHRRSAADQPSSSTRCSPTPPRSPATTCIAPCRTPPSCTRPSRSWAFRRLVSGLVRLDESADRLGRFTNLKIITGRLRVTTKPADLRPAERETADFVARRDDPASTSSPLARTSVVFMNGEAGRHARLRRPLSRRRRRRTRSLLAFLLVLYAMRARALQLAAPPQGGARRRLRALQKLHRGRPPGRGGPRPAASPPRRRRAAGYRRRRPPWSPRWGKKATRASSVMQSSCCSSQRKRWHGNAIAALFSRPRRVSATAPVPSRGDHARPHYSIWAPRGRLAHFRWCWT